MSLGVVGVCSSKKMQQSPRFSDIVETNHWSQSPDRGFQIPDNYSFLNCQEFSTLGLDFETC
jgi:hypothetical protein